MRSNTLSLGVSHYFVPELLVNVVYRRYDQTGAFFWAPEYSGSPQYYTADFRLEPFTSNNYSGRLVLTPKGHLLGLPDGTGLTVQYERYQSDNGFHAAIVSTGLRVPVKIFGSR